MSTGDLVRISQPDLGPEVEESVLGVLRSGQLAMGPRVQELEELCCAMAGSSHAVAVGNGTQALEAAFSVLGLGPGDEVITTPLTFAATLNSLLHTGATVRFADVTADYTIDVDSVRSLIGPRTAAVVPVHLYGLPADLGSLRTLVGERGLAMVEDAAQAHGATWHGAPVGSQGIATFSFYATKNVGAGEGGVVTCNDEATADSLRLLRNQGMRRRYEYEVVGRNLRMTDLHAAVAVPQLRRLAQRNAARSRIAVALTAVLQSDARVTVPLEPAGRRSAWHQYTVLLEPGTDRQAVVDHMRAGGVEAGIYYPGLVWDHEVYRASAQVVPDPTPRAADVAARCLSLPVHPGVEGHEDRVAAALLAALG